MMNAFLKLKSGFKYPLIVNGFHFDDDSVRVAIVCDKTLEEIREEFSAKENTEILTIENKAGETIEICNGYVILDSKVSMDTNCEISPQEYGKDGQITSEAVCGKVAFLSLYKETVEHKTAQNTADIDYLALMTGVELFRG